MTDKTALKAKLAALLAKTIEAGATEDEAMAAAERAQRIMVEHNITLEDIEASDVDRNAFGHWAEKTRGSRYNVVTKCTMMAIADYCGVRCWVQRGETFDGVRSNAHIEEHFAGYAADVEHATFLLNLTKEAAEHECRVWARLYGNTSAKDRDDFKIGMGRRVAKRLREMAPTRAQAASQPGGTALVVAKANAVANYLKTDLGVNLQSRSTSSTRQRNQDAIRAGDAAGARMGLHRGGGGGGRSGPALIGRL